MDKLNNKTGITFRLQVKDYKFRSDEGNTFDFEDCTDLHRLFAWAIGHVVDEYVFEELLKGDISNITIVLSPDNLKEEDFVTENTGYKL
ncbi:MAG TPA: hypothetical protein VGS28_01695 [Candidatus Saccharimonadales bacterium]|nr:hypothetical protein [Candidatus Saccharimonadales bacterium]